ncbi:hypothetical protein [Streptomyces sp. NPDC002990]
MQRRGDVTASVGWLGAAAAFLALAVAGLTSRVPQTVRGSYLAMDVIGWHVIVPSSIAALLTGLCSRSARRGGCRGTDGSSRNCDHRGRDHEATRGFRFDTAGRPLLIDTNGDSCLVPCTAHTCRRWVEAALAYATAVDDISAKLVAASHRARSIPRWRVLAARLALRNWEKTRQRYERVMQEASEAYQPVRREIRRAMRIEKDKAGAHARETHRRKAELAE